MAENPFQSPETIKLSHETPRRLKGKADTVKNRRSGILMFAVAIAVVLLESFYWAGLTAAGREAHPLGRSIEYLINIAALAVSIATAVFGTLQGWRYFRTGESWSKTKSWIGMISLLMNVSWILLLLGFVTAKVFILWYSGSS